MQKAKAYAVEGLEEGGDDPKTATDVVHALYAKYKKNYNRRTDYVALFSFLVFVTFYLSILFMQRKAEEAYSLTSTLTAAFIPAATTMGGKNEVLNWIDSVVTTSWVEPQCGDGRCEAPFEFPEYGRFGCKADCNIISANMNITKIQIDLYYNFSHPKGSISPIDLMNDAKWNLCPMEQDENVGPKKIFHGTDCYYEEDQGFEDQVGHIIRKIDDVPDGDWTIVVKKDIFLKVAGAVRPRVNVTKEATHKRLLLAAHYAQTRRKIELDMYDKILADLAQTNFTLHSIISDPDKLYLTMMKRILSFLFLVGAVRAFTPPSSVTSARSLATSHNNCNNHNGRLSPPPPSSVATSATALSERQWNFNQGRGPWGLKKNAEIWNGRVAQMAFVVVLLQEAVTGKGVVASVQDGDALGYAFLALAGVSTLGLTLWLAIKGDESDVVF